MHEHTGSSTLPLASLWLNKEDAWIRLLAGSAAAPICFAAAGCGALIPVQYHACMVSPSDSQSFWANIISRYYHCTWAIRPADELVLEGLWEGEQLSGSAKAPTFPTYLSLQQHRGRQSH